MAKELAPRRGASVTNTAGQAEHEAMLQRFRQLHWPQGVSSQALQSALYSDQGLPA